MMSTRDSPVWLKTAFHNGAMVDARAMSMIFFMVASAALFALKLVLENLSGYRRSHDHS
jgi:hypothetical protein